MQVPKSPHSARSRAPIDTAGIKWWDQYGSLEPNFGGKRKVDEKSEPANGQGVKEKNLPKDKILRKWREVQSRARFEAARAAIINSLKTKYREQTNVTTIGDNAETETSTNCHRDSATQTILKLLPTREGLTTPRSARAPVARRTGTLPHQRLKREKSMESPPEMDSPCGSVGSDLRRQNEELRARLAGESADHRRRLDAYRRAQQGQAALVSRLQAKRDTATLKRAWDNLKAMTRKVRRARAIERTGDGPVLPPQPPPQQVAIMNMVEQACPAIMCEIYNPYDSDAVTRASNNSQSESFQLQERPSGSDGELAPNQLYECQMGEGAQEEQTPDQLYECQIQEGAAEERPPNRLNERRRRAPARINENLIRREAALRSKAMEMKLKILKLKVLQYKQRCSELEQHMLETTPRSEPSYRAAPTTARSAIAQPAPAALPSTSSSDTRRDERIADLETALRRLDEEKRKCEKLVTQNNLLRDQLEESHQLNEALTNDLQQLTNDWEALRDEMNVKEDEWKDEEQAFNDYYTSEHNRLLSLWREVVSVKRFFSELQTTTERDLFKVKNDFESATRELVGTLSGYAINAYAQGPRNFSQPQTDHQAVGMASSAPNITIETLRIDLRDVTSQRDTAQAELRERDARIQRLLGELQGLEERYEVAEAMCSEANAMRSALEEVARALIQDSEADVPSAQHLHMSERSPRRGVPQAANATAFAESTISAVQAALHKYQIQIHELQVKLQNTREQLAASRKHGDAADATILSLENKVQDLQVKLDQANADLNQLSQDKESMQKSVETLRIDKNNLERNRVEINAMVESLTSDYEKLQKINSRLEKTIEALETDKRTLNAEVDHLHREASNRESILRAEEERSARTRSELVSVREELHRTGLARDLLEQQRLEADAVVGQLEKHRSELEVELERTLLERGDLQDLTDKLQAAIRNLENDRKKLQEEVKHLEDEKSSLSSQSSEQLGDLNSLRKELLSAEQTRMELEADKASLQEKIKFIEGDREKVELELRQVVRERGELSSQLTAMVRKKDTLNEEIMRLQQRLEQAGETIGRVNRALEDRVKHGEEMQILIDSLDKDKQHLQEQLASVRAEKDALEAVLFDTANLLDDAEARRAQLDRDLRDALLQQENHKGQIARLSKELESSERKVRETRSAMQQQSGKKEAEYQSVIANIKRSSAENITKLKEEKEQLRQSLEHKLSQTIAALTSEKEASDAGAREREKKLLVQRDQLILQHDEAMLRAESDKQQALIMAHQEQQALIERLEEAKRVLDCSQNKLERVKRDAAARAGQDRGHVNQLKDELAALKTRLEEAKAAAEDDCARFENRIKELHLEKEAGNRECQEARAQLALAEDRHDAAYTQLQDTIRKLKELENESESLRKELTDVRRQLNNCIAERDKYNSSCRELRDHVKRAEHERRAAARARDEAVHSVAALEENRSSLEMELSRLQSMLKESESGGEHVTRELRAAEAQLKRERAALEQAGHDNKELQSRLQNESEERERACNEAAAARRHGAELEALLGAARADLAAARQRGAELEEACRARDQELVLRLEDCRSKERRLEELKHNLEVCLADATQQIQELKARLGGSEGRCRALEASFAQCEAGKREAEAKLSSIAHTLRRVCGVQPDGSVHAAARRRLASPARRYSPHRGRDHSEDRNEVIDVDPELVKKGVRHLMHEVCQIERERDDYKSQMNVLKKQLKDASEQQGKGDTKLQSITTNLRSLQEEKGRMQNVIGQKDAQINGLNESVQSKTVEISNLRDRITSLEATLSSITEEKVQNENKGESLRVQLAERVQEVGQLREALAAAEGRAARLDVRRAQLEGDGQRAAVAARDREQALKKLQERCEGYCRTIASLEDRCTSLKGTVEQLSTSLQKAATAESDLRAELSKTQRMLNEAKNNEQNALDKLRQLQKNCANCENERRVLSEKLESAKSALGELRRLNCTLEDQLHRLTAQLANVEVQRSGLESQLRMTTWDGKESADSELERELHALQRERSELKAKNDALQEAMRKMEADRRLNRTTALRSKSHDRTEKTVYYSDLDSGPDSTKDSMRYPPTKDSNLSVGKEKSFTAELSLLELENRELRMKIRRMEKELADKEAELKLARTRYLSDQSSVSPSRREDVERYRQAALQAERLLEAREASHRQQMIRLENQASQLRTQLSAEIRRRQSYVARSGRAARDVQRLRSALGDSLRTVSQDPALDSYTLEHEARKLDSTLAHSLPPLNDSYDSSK